MAIGSQFCRGDVAQEETKDFNTLLQNFPQMEVDLCSDGLRAEVSLVRHDTEESLDSQCTKHYGSYLQPSLPLPHQAHTIKACY